MQKHIVNEYFIAWWNVENLFDIENSTSRPKELKEMLKRELKGWDQTVLQNKLTQLTKIISRMNNNNGPDLLGVCEIENGPVLEKFIQNLTNMTNRKYQRADAETDEKRGIEVAFIYDSDKFEADEENIISHHVLRRGFTRHILQVNLTIKNSNTKLIAIGNHWPARTGGVFETEPFRMAAGEALNHFHKEILKDNEDANIIVMGDFNDEPYNRSMLEYALTTNNISKLMDADKEKPYFFNIMWPLLSQGQVTFCNKDYSEVKERYPEYIPNGSPKECYYDPYYRDNPSQRNHYRPPIITPNMLDQFLVSKSIILEKELRIKEGSVAIITDEIKEEICDNPYRYTSPKKFGRPSQSISYNPQGYSDHFPITLTIEKK